MPSVVAACGAAPKPLCHCLIMLKDSIRNDPEVFASVFKQLKKYENKVGFAQEAATQCPLDLLFNILPKRICTSKAIRVPSSIDPDPLEIVSSFQVVNEATIRENQPSFLQSAITEHSLRSGDIQVRSCLESRSSTLISRSFP